MGLKMIVYCNGLYVGDQFYQALDCPEEKTIRGYAEIEDDPEWAEFDPSEKCIDDKIYVPALCVYCCAGSEALANGKNVEEAEARAEKWVKERS